jgi:hypothetical protein
MKPQPSTTSMTGGVLANPENATRSTRGKENMMNRWMRPTYFALAALALLGLARSNAHAAANLVPFKVTMKVPPATLFALPSNPQSVWVQQTLTGESDLLGAFTWVDRHVAYLGVDGIGKAVTGNMAFTASNGDALFLTWIGLIHSPGVTEDAFFVTGGSGRFAGAKGSGVLTTAPDATTKVLTWSYEGMISAPAAN